MSTCFVLSPVLLLFDSHIAPTFSTYTEIGSSTVMFMVCNSCTMNFNSFTTSESAMYSASVVDSTTLFIPFAPPSNWYSTEIYNISIYANPRFLVTCNVTVT